MSNDSILSTYEKMMKTFLVLLHKKNPNLKISFHVSFDEIDKKYKDGKFVAQANKQPESPEFIFQVDGNFDLPCEEYDELELRCTSWRNNGYNGGIPKEISDKQREELPRDFDIVSIQGNPLENNSTNLTTLSFYVIGGCANKMDMEMEKSSPLGR